MIHNSRLSHGLSSQHHHDWIWLNSQDIQDIPRLINSCHGMSWMTEAQSITNPDEQKVRSMVKAWNILKCSNRWQRLPWNANLLCSCFMLNFGKCMGYHGPLLPPAEMMVNCAGPWRHHFAAPSGGGLKICQRESGNGSASSSQIWPLGGGQYP